jgi:phosphopantothenoylcysteine decarboxylase/phosphopantothenate--cysteine ligase
MLSTTVMATKAPVLFAPAMNSNMYNNPILQRNIDILKSYGYSFIEPDVGRLACGITGKGKLADTEKIIDFYKYKDYKLYIAVPPYFIEIYALKLLTQVTL